jgi:hypothetical protein
MKQKNLIIPGVVVVIFFTYNNSIIPTKVVISCFRLLVGLWQLLGSPLSCPTVISFIGFFNSRRLSSHCRFIDLAMEFDMRPQVCLEFLIKCSLMYHFTVPVTDIQWPNCPTLQEFWRSCTVRNDFLMYFLNMERAPA